jgi:hypothetical protein
MPSKRFDLLPAVMARSDLGCMSICGAVAVRSLSGVARVALWPLVDAWWGGGLCPTVRLAGDP